MQNLGHLFPDTKPADALHFLPSVIKDTTVLDGEFTPIKLMKDFAAMESQVLTVLFYYHHYNYHCFGLGISAR